MSMKFGMERVVGSVRMLYENRSEPENMHKLADLAWNLLLAVAAFFSLFAGIYGIVELRSSLTPLSVPVQPSSREILERAQLERVLEMFVARAVRYNDLKTYSEVVADPK